MDVEIYMRKNLQWQNSDNNKRAWSKPLASKINSLSYQFRGNQSKVNLYQYKRIHSYIRDKNRGKISINDVQRVK